MWLDQYRDVEYFFTVTRYEVNLIEPAGNFTFSDESMLLRKYSVKLSRCLLI